MSPRECVRWSVAAYGRGDGGQEVCVFTTHQLDSLERVLVESVLAAERPGVARVAVTEHTWRYVCRWISQGDLPEPGREAGAATASAGADEVVALRYVVAVSEADVAPQCDDLSRGPDTGARDERQGAGDSQAPVLEVTVVRVSRPVSLRDLTPSPHNVI